MCKWVIPNLDLIYIICIYDDDLSCSRSVIVVVTISIKLGSTFDACKTIICS